MEGRLGRFLNRFRQKPDLLEIPQHDSIDDSGPVVYKGDSIIIDPHQLPVGGEGYPIRWFGIPARAKGDGKGGFEIFEDNK